MMTKIQKSMASIFFSVFSVLSVLPLVLGLAGCAEDKAASFTSGTFTAVYNQTLKSACIQCHSPGGGQGTANLDFSTQASAYSSLVNRPVSGAVSNGSGQCSGVKLVAPSNPNASFLLSTLSNTYPQSGIGGAASCFAYSIHQTDQALSSAEISSLAQWIASGALNN